MYITIIHSLKEVSFSFQTVIALRVADKLGSGSTPLIPGGRSRQIEFNASLAYRVGLHRLKRRRRKERVADKEFSSGESRDS